MLKKCADGFTIEDKEHLRWIRYNGKTAMVPKGAHGAREDNYDIKIGQVKSLVSQLKVDPDCASKNLPQLPKPKNAAT